MKKSHKRIIDLMNRGAWLSRNPHSYKTDRLLIGTKWIMDVRVSTIEEMRKCGLLVLENVYGTRQLVPAERLRNKS